MMSDDDREHGTRAAWNWHMRHRVPICDPCRDANRAYLNEWRNKNTEGRDRERKNTAANSRALWRLARTYPREFQVLAAEERARGGAA